VTVCAVSHIPSIVSVSSSKQLSIQLKEIYRNALLTDLFTNSCRSAVILSNSTAGNSSTKNELYFFSIGSSALGAIDNH